MNFKHPHFREKPVVFFFFLSLFFDIKKNLRLLFFPTEYMFFSQIYILISKKFNRN